MLNKGHIEPTYLIRLCIKTCCTLIAGTALSAGIIWLVTIGFESQTYGGAISQIDKMQAGLVKITILCAAAQVFSVVLFLAIIGIFASHKIAGPLVRFERCVEELGRGNLVQSIQFREGDQNRRLPHALVEACAALRKRVGMGAMSAETIGKLATEIEQGQGSVLDAEELQKVLAIAAECEERLRAAGTLLDAALPASKTGTGSNHE